MKSAERIALAVANGDVPANALPAALEALRQLNKRAEVKRQAAALHAFRAGEPVWTWSKTAPWSGF